MTLLFWALWGLAGAFVYAAPRVLVAAGEGKVAGKSIWSQVAEFFVALTFGPIFSAGLGPFAANYLGRESAKELTAIALVIGMVANPVAPILVKLATGEVVRRLGGAFKGDKGQ